MKNVVQCGPSITIIKQFSGPTLKRATNRCIYLSPQRCLNMETDAGKSDKQLITSNLIGQEQTKQISDVTSKDAK